MVDYMFREMAYALADKEDAEYINGDSTSTYGGVTGLLASLGAGGVSTAATGHDTWVEIDLTDVTNWMALLPSKYHARNPKIICSSQFYYSVLLRIAAAAGGNTLASLTGGPGGTKNFLGTEVLITPYMPTASAAATVHALFGAFDAGVILAERTPIRLARSDDYAFLNDVITIKATSRYDINVHDGGTASVPGAYVGLKSAA
jgi:HK97 family phage major capsid protein